LAWKANTEGMGERLLAKMAPETLRPSLKTIQLDSGFPAYLLYDLEKGKFSLMEWCQIHIRWHFLQKVNLLFHWIPQIHAVYLHFKNGETDINLVRSGDG
jgi:hypothetical protein